MAENKMAQVAAMNNFDKLLGRNGELVELRKEQVLAGAMNIVQQHYADKPNKMKAIAQLFGKELDEEFKLEITSFFSWRKVFTVKFAKTGLEYLTKHNTWEQINWYIPYLLTGEASIVDDQKEGEKDDR